MFLCILSFKMNISVTGGCLKSEASLGQDKLWPNFPGQCSSWLKLIIYEWSWGNLCFLIAMMPMQSCLRYGTKYFCILDSKLKEKKGLEFYRKIKRNGPRLENVECSEFWLRILTVEGKLFGRATFEYSTSPAPIRKVQHIK